MEKKRTDFLYLSEPDMIKAGVLDFERCIDVIDEVFHLLGKGDYVMGGPNHNAHGLKITFPKEPAFPGMPADGPDRRFMAMVTYLGGRFQVCGDKWYGSNVINPSRGLPRSILMLTLNDPDTCEPIALMSANLISAMRTGTVPGVGTRYLAGKDAKVCAVIGAGPVNKAAFQSIKTAAGSLEKVVVFDLFPEKAAEFAKWAAEELGIAGVAAQTLEEAVSAGDIVSVAASRIKPVEIQDAWLKEGSLLILTGNALLDESYLLSSTIVFDNPLMHQAYIQDVYDSPDPEQAFATIMVGQIYKMICEGRLPSLDIAPALGKIVLGDQPGRQSQKERICFIAGGMPVHDVAWGFEIYSRAKEMGLGQTLNLWEGAHWT